MPHPAHMAVPNAELSNIRRLSELILSHYLFFVVTSHHFPLLFHDHHLSYSLLEWKMELFSYKTQACFAFIVLQRQRNNSNNFNELDFSIIYL